ncbi:hypothetical protein [Halolamina sediminis]|uniref:hypothetical protein n=1 Tax=Halolamina sediminis TaxID=1480675 RepID=UPI00137927D0|nr:hypothetical protein [Halolamina sediminis]
MGDPVRRLSKCFHGATNPVDADQRKAAREQFGPDGAKAVVNVRRPWLPRFVDTHIDKRDACIAGHLHWLAEEHDDVLGIVATGHIPGVAERLNGERELAERLICQPTYADPEAIPEHLVGNE